MRSEKQNALYAEQTESTLEDLHENSEDRTPTSSFLLVAVAGPNRGQTYGYEKAEILIGRSPETDLSLDDKLVSRRHCMLRLTRPGPSLSKTFRAITEPLWMTNRSTAHFSVRARS